MLLWLSFIYAIWDHSSRIVTMKISEDHSLHLKSKKARFLLKRVNMCPKWEKYFWQLKQITLTWPKTIQRGRVLVAKPTSCLKKYFSIFTSFHPIILKITIGWWEVLLEWMTIWWMRECIQSGVRASLGVSQTSFATNRHTLEPWFFTSVAWT